MFTLVIAVVGLVLSAIAITVQIVTWRFEGPRVKVEVGFGFPFRGRGTGDLHLTVTARNLGRAPVEINSWGFDLGKELTGVITRSGPGLYAAAPHTLNGGHQAMFLVPRELPGRAAEGRSGHLPRVRRIGDRRAPTLETDRASQGLQMSESSTSERDGAKR